jgi:transcriptional regulator with XRE-family HTH domain
MRLSIRIRFGRKVCALRKQAGLSQEALAARSKLHRNYIGGIERGERNPGIDSVEKLAKALRVSLQDLFSGL